MPMHMLELRIGKLLDNLENMTVRKRLPAENILYAERGKEDFKPFANGSDWTGWLDFRFTLTTPADFALRTALTVRTGREAGWEAVNPQIVVWVNGKIEQAFDTKHVSLILDEEAVPGKSYEIFLQAYTPDPLPMQPVSRMLLELCEIDAEVEGLYHDIRSPWESACLMPEDDRDREQTLYALSEAANLLDLREPGSEAFRASVRAAREYLQKHYYEPRQSLPPVAVADCIGHTHIDVAWLWDLYQSRWKSVRTFATMLKLMEQYPEFKFMSSQPVLYKFVKEDAPEVYARIKEAVARGQWEVEGGMWVEADCNLSSGEALVRQFLHGQEFFRKEFGKSCRVLWLPDVFGYSAALPQILKLCDIDYFMTSKLSWSEYNKYPYDTFTWKGIDGSEVLTHFTPAREYVDGNDPLHATLKNFTTYNAMLSPQQIKGGWKRFQQKGLDDHFLVSYGYGDGGGGSTDWMIENARRMATPLPGCPVVRQTFARDFFEELEKRVKGNPRLPKWTGELYLEFHRGTYTSIAKNKRNNRKMELQLRETELWSAYAAKHYGYAYPAAALHDIWEDALTLQFHDILPGSSIKKVYDDSDEIYARRFAELDALLKQAMDAIAQHMDGDVLAFNSLSFERSDMIAFDAPKDVLALKDAAGRQYELQRGEGGCTAFVEDMPPLSVTPLYFLRAVNADSAMRVDEKGFDTPFFHGEFDQSMRITSLIDLRNGRQIVKEGQALNRIVCYENRPHNHDAWDINIYYDEKSWEVDDLRAVEIVERGPIKTVLRATYAYSLSTVVQDIVIYQNIDRLDFVTTVDWKEDHGMLKAHFPVDVFYNEATYDIQYGNVRRPTVKNTSWDVARFEVCAHKWADVSEPNYGAALLNDCKYGHSIDENGMALTLLKSASAPNPVADREVHHFTYSFMPHMGDWRTASVPEMAYMLNIPVRACAGQGKGAPCKPFVTVDAENVMIEAVKQQLDGTGTVIRMYECFGERTEVNMQLGFAPKSLKRVNLLEETIEELPAADECAFTLKPYEIRTYLVD